MKEDDYQKAICDEMMRRRDKAVEAVLFSLSAAVAIMAAAGAGCDAVLRAAAEARGTESICEQCGSPIEPGDGGKCPCRKNAPGSRRRPTSPAVSDARPSASD